MTPEPNYSSGDDASAWMGTLASGEPSVGWTGRSERVNRYFWRSTAWEVRFWLTFTALAVIVGLAFVIWVIVHAL
jgi:hypothetical protein